MSVVTWLGFSISSTVTRSLLHFFPSAEGVGAPYPVECSISVSGGNQPRRTVNVDGARLGNPDGLRIEDAFPTLGQQISGLYIVTVQLTTSQPRVDLGASNCVLELNYQHSTVRFWPRRIALGEEARSKSIPLGGGRGISNPFANFCTALIARDPMLQSALVIVNGAAAPVLAMVCFGEGDDIIAERVSIPAESVKEFDSFERFSAYTSKSDVSWGAIESLPLKVSFEEPRTSPDGSIQSSGQPLSLGAAVAAYLVYRDRSSRRLVSVIAL